MKLAGAPISWGVCEVPGWGYQLEPGRVLADMRALGLGATEAGPPGFLPADQSAARALLQTHALRMIGGFVTAVLHRPEIRATELASVERQASWLAGLGAEVLVLALASGQVGYSQAAEIGDAGWTALFAALDKVERIAATHRLTLAVHPHFGTAIERASHVDRFLEGCRHGLCLDTGHIALGGGDPVDVATRAGDRVRHVHLKDVEGTLGPLVRDRVVDYGDGVRQGVYCELGKGTAAIAEVLALLRGRGYRGWYVLEQDVMLGAAPDGIPDQITRSVAFARANA